MKKIKIILSHPLATATDIDLIRLTDSRVDVVHAVYTDRFALRSKEPSGSVLTGSKAPDFRSEVKDAEIIHGLGLPDDILQIAPRLKWVQVLGAGMDYLSSTGLLESHVTITNSGGVNAKPIAEYCLLVMLQHTKQWTNRLQAQREHRWTRYTNDELTGRTLGIIGAGYIAQALAQRATACDMRVLAVRRSYVPGQTLPNVERLFPIKHLHEMLRQCDYVVAAMVLTDETKGMLGDAEFRAMKPGAFFINVARGPVVDNHAMLRALQDGHLSGAGLDVFDPEPMPAESPFWNEPNVVVTAHNSGGMKDLSYRSAQLFSQNLARYIKGEPLHSVIDPARGY